MNFLLLMLSLVCKPFFASAPQNDTALSSAHADYDGNALVLTGQVRLDHGLGKMEAEHAILERQEGNKEFPFAHIFLEKGVKLFTTTQSQIECARADLDFTQLKGKLFSTEENPVIFREEGKGKEKSRFSLTGNLIDLDFIKLAKEGEKSLFGIQSITAKEGVVIEYAQQLKIFADHAIYNKPENAAFSKELQGTVTAYPKDSDSTCLLTHEEDRVEADAIDLNLQHSAAVLIRPRGTLSSQLTAQVRKGPLHLSSDQLVWDELKNSVTLKGNIRLDDPNLGSIQAAEELALNHGQSNGKRVLKMIRTRGPTQIKYRETPTQPIRTLICQGSMRFERDKLATFLESPKVKGRVPQDKQVQYIEKDFSVFCDQAAIDYAVTDHSLHPSSVALKGNIRLFNQDLSGPKRCALADRVTYSPETRTLILAANTGKKVLFWDEGQTIHISAQEVHITRDAETQADSVKGYGQVKFNFTVEESNTLKELFPFITLLNTP